VGRHGRTGRSEPADSLEQDVHPRAGTEKVVELRAVSFPRCSAAHVDLQPCDVTRLATLLAHLFNQIIAIERDYRKRHLGRELVGRHALGHAIHPVCGSTFEVDRFVQARGYAVASCEFLVVDFRNLQGSVEPPLRAFPVDIPGEESIAAAAIEPCVLVPIVVHRAPRLTSYVDSTRSTAGAPANLLVSRLAKPYCRSTSWATA
jgi:hypothetical protein